MNRILIVEDEDDIASVLVDYLGHAGYQTERVADGERALERMLQEPPDLTLLDNSCCRGWTAWRCCGAPACTARIR